MIKWSKSIFIIKGRLVGSGYQFCDQLLRYPLMIRLKEILVKDKKQKEGNFFKNILSNNLIIEYIILILYLYKKLSSP